MLNDLIKISDLSVDDVEKIVFDAQRFKTGLLDVDSSSKNLCLMFFENSSPIFAIGTCVFHAAII